MRNYKFSQQNFILSGEEYSSYNIEYSENGEQKCIYDVSTDREAVAAFVDKLNRNDASPIHIHELVEDFISNL